MAHSSKQVVLRGESQSIIASQTAQAISDNFGIPWEFSTNYIVAILVTSSTVTNSIVAKLQTRLSSEAAWRDSKTVAITTGASNTTFHITLLDAVAGDQALLPLMPQGRIVITTGVGDECVIAKIWVPITGDTGR